MKRYVRELSVAAVLTIVLIWLAILAPSFYQPQPLLSLVTREMPTLAIACGMTLVIIARQIDISVGSQFSVCSVTAGLLSLHGFPLWAVVPLTITSGAVLGAINGVLVAALELPSIVVTLATMVTLRQGLNLFQQGRWVALPEPVQWLGLGQIAGQWLLIGCTLAVLAGLALAMRYLSAGRFIYAVGSNAEAARLAGIRPRIGTWLIFALLGALTGFAAIMNIVQSPQIQPVAGTGLELKVIAAVVVGGVAISGGRGNLLGVFAGFLLLACIAPALTHLHIEAYWEKAIQGGIILLAVVADGIRSRKGVRHAIA